MRHPKHRPPVGPRRRRRQAHPPAADMPCKPVHGPGGPRRRKPASEHGQKVAAAWRVFPKLRRGKKAPPHALLIPPPPHAPKKDRYQWSLATAAADADLTIDTDEDT